ncbi:prolipoprotein diacylglyceryl transferase [Rariglobus hedericola]|uniref:Phosphatidylglycerol--prolipoprotein diacylglyceryl transferase n=1 Tax=Rariglobus hedericola TaxID=2597822 RepID=A0A556QNE1_9BACT|nr:prolipoprotein diacylglyceryl transferase [Rariglobus hedericola]TSJ78161.1 prolipoprotein diacylglyceryl transferase [Rariglobus hedericola]
MFLAYWVHNLSPFVIQFSDTFGIRYYGLAYLLGFVGGAGLLHVYAKAGRSRLPSVQISDFIIAIVVGVMVGGRLGSFLLYEGWRTLGEDPFAIFRVWEGGMASHGGFIGVALAMAWFARNRKLPFLHLSDLIVSVAPLGLMLGRIANFINGELWGKVTNVAWAVIFPSSAPEGAPVALIPPRHPSQLYEAALEGALLLAFVQWRFWRTDVVRRQPGRLAGEFLIAYAVVRMFGELFREPDEGIALIMGLSRGTFYSIFLIGVGLVLILRKPHAAPPVKPQA